ncbi:MAG: hypothetical protein BM559_09005 [Roseobacter sp. MedPE-SWchi]|nr:MAG: hypothetical protein BM559_09005 [Roseobacter sp. MedPE-SWchi]
MTLAQQYAYDLRPPFSPVPAAVTRLVAEGNHDLHLRVDASKVTYETPTAGVVNWAYTDDADGLDLFLVHDLGDGSFAFECKNRPNVFLATIPTDLSPTTQTTTVPSAEDLPKYVKGAMNSGNCNIVLGPDEAYCVGTCVGFNWCAAFKLTEEQNGAWTLSPVQYPDWHMSADPTVRGEVTANGAGHAGYLQNLDVNLRVMVKFQYLGATASVYQTYSRENFSAGVAMEIVPGLMPGFKGEKMKICVLQNIFDPSSFARFNPLGFVTSVPDKTLQLGEIAWSKTVDTMSIFKEVSNDDGSIYYESLAAPGRCLWVNNFNHGDPVLSCTHDNMDATVRTVSEITPENFEKGNLAPSGSGGGGGGGFGGVDVFERVGASISAAVASMETDADLKKIKAAFPDAADACFVTTKSGAIFGRAAELHSALTKDELHEVITKYAPILHLHPDEPYKMCSVDWFVEHANLAHEGQVVQNGPLTQDALPKGDISTLPPKDDGFSLPLVSKDVRSGDMSTARAYVRANWNKGDQFTDLQFFFCYAFNGPGRALARVFEADTLQKQAIIDLAPLGDHEADWEFCSIRIDHSTLKPSAVYLSQHSGGAFYSTPENLARFKRTGEQIHIYASKNGHASYHDISNNYSNPLNYTKLGFGLTVHLINETKAGGDTLDCGKKYEVIGADWLGVTPPPWVSFTGRWGATGDMAERGEVSTNTVRQVENLLEVVLDDLGGIGNAAKYFIREAGSDLATEIMKSKGSAELDLGGPTGPISKDEWTSKEWASSGPRYSGSDKEYAPPPALKGKGNEAALVAVKMLNGAATVASAPADFVIDAASDSAHDLAHGFAEGASAISQGHVGKGLEKMGEGVLKAGKDILEDGFHTAKKVVSTFEFWKWKL